MYTSKRQNREYSDKPFQNHEMFIQSIKFK